jgi:hypothetical protein
MLPAFAPHNVSRDVLFHTRPIRPRVDEMIDTVRADLDAATAAHFVVSNATEVENMFRDIVEPSIRVGSRKPFALPLSIAVHVILVAVLLLVPLMAPGVLPTPAAALMAFVSRDVALPPSLPPAQRQPVAATQPSWTSIRTLPRSKRRARSPRRGLSSQRQRSSDRLKMRGTC